MTHSALIPIGNFTVFARGLDHPESIAFDQAGNLWAGGEAGQIYRIDCAGNAVQVGDLGSFCAGLAFSPDGDLFICHPASGVVRMKHDGKHELFASHAGDHRIQSSNFGLFDQAGNYYVTDSGNWMQHNGFLLHFTPDGIGRVVAGPFGYANGLALSADQKTLFMVESNTNRVYTLSILPDGSITDTTIFAEHVGRFPDGLTLDTRGNLYVTCYASDEVIRITPSGEKQLLAHDPWGIMLGGPTNSAFAPGTSELYIANLSRYTITKVDVGTR